MKVVILGANGMLGTYLTRHMTGKYDLLPLTRQDIDLACSKKELLDFFEKSVSENDVIVNAAGLIKHRDYNIEEMIKVNSILPHVLNDLKKSKRCEVIHITTDCVFSGKMGSYDEKAHHDCLDDYGKTKSLGENPDNTNIRTSIIGEELHNKRSLIEWVKSNKSGSINGFDNHMWNGVTCLHLAENIHKIITQKNFWRGTKHLYSPHAVSKFELVSMINSIYELNITINRVKTSSHCFRNLTSLHTPMITKDIYRQIKEQKEFGVI